MSPRHSVLYLHFIVIITGSVWMCRNQLTLQANCQSKYLLIPTVTCAQVRLEAVEIDGEMSKVASDWFGFRHNNNVTVHIADGLHFISQLATRGGNVGLFVSIAH